MIILKAPFKFDREEFNKRIHIELYEDMEEEIENVLSICVNKISPKIIFSEKKVLYSNKKIKVDEQLFTDEALINRLKGIEKIFPYVVTCGDEIDDFTEFNNDMLMSFWVDALKQMSMDRAFNYFRLYLKDKYNIDKLYSISPGSNGCGEGWILEDQTKLFNFFPNINNDIGVTLTESLLMLPNKTVSGFMFESDKDFISCQECKNIHCQNRRMIHDGAIL